MRIIISNIKTDVTDKSEEQKKKTFAKQKSVLSNAEMLLIKRGELLNQFAKNNIFSRHENFFDAAKKIEKKHTRKIIF